MKSKVRQRERSGCFFYIFFSIFALAGTLIFALLTVRPIYQLISAQSWIATPCRINSSEVEEIPGDDGYTYRIAITYSYQVGEQTYSGERYDFSGFSSSSGFDAKARVVAEYPPDLETFCFVDPAHPQSSVISNSPGLYLLWGLFPLPFMAVGYGGLLWIFFSGGPNQSKADGRPKRGTGRQSALTSGRPLVSASNREEAMATSSQTLTASQSPWLRVAIVAGIAVIWNGVIAVPIFSEVIPGIRAGEVPWMITLFMIPFSLVGLGLIGFVGYLVLAVFNPRFHVDLDDAYLTVGETCSVRWRFEGRIDRIRKLTISFEGREEATYRRGTSSHTDRHTFYSEQLLSTEHGASMSRGNLELRVPTSTMPSFESSNNKICWVLTVEADIPYWPDVTEELALVIHPRAGAERG